MGTMGKGAIPAINYFSKDRHFKENDPHDPEIVTGRKLNRLRPLLQQIYNAIIFDYYL